uniref:39S ribosomal protein L18, mitochondrial isoform X2 n=1 Tax=Urocitellus parryii TaxID=9999 RepID=UPI000E55D93F|nr:39S ribosomal protein L18, mitochondrial isoform X2 [Urocitellus parryii]XP_026238460.1 39S ribosomal protein L18, mitochondrial isoform X2 [Urocitellus parryii]
MCGRGLVGLKLQGHARFDFSLSSYGGLAAETTGRKKRRGFAGDLLSDGTSAAALEVGVGSQESGLRVIKTQHHVEAIVEHRNGKVVVSASTREWAIKKHLYRTRNVVACESIGRVLAERCLEAGINFMVYQPTPWEAASDSMKRLQSAMTEGGVVLQEPRRIYE